MPETRDPRLDGLELSIDERVAGVVMLTALRRYYLTVEVQVAHAD